MYEHWFVSRQKRKLTTILPALIAFSDVCVGEKWSGNTELQLKFEDELQNRSITEHGSLRARKEGNGGGGTRTLFKQMKDLGLVFLEDETNKCRITLISEDIIKGSKTFVDAMRIQLQKYQYPSATSWSGSGAISHDFKVHPFQFLLRLLMCEEIKHYLTMDEMRYIVIHYAKSDSKKCFDEVVQYILEYRSGGILPKMIDDSKKTYWNIANTFFNYIGLTQYIDRGASELFLRKGKEAEVNDFIQDNPTYIPHPELSENYIRAYGRGTYAKDLRDFTKEKGWSQKELNESRIRKEYVLYGLTTPIESITPDIVHDISLKTGIDEKFVEHFLVQNYPHGNIDDFFLGYKELAHLGTSGARDFEVATCQMFDKVFHMRAVHVGPIGNTPDVFVESETEKFCGIIDNKAYKDGYSISGPHRRVMEDEYIPNAMKYGHAKYPLAFFGYIAGSFGANINSQIEKIHDDTGISGAAMPVDLLIDFAQDYAAEKRTHKDIKKVFSVNREIRISDLKEFKDK